MSENSDPVIQNLGGSTSLREALEKIRRTPVMPFPDRGAHSERAFADAVWTAWSRIQRIADAALSAPPEQPEPGDAEATRKALREYERGETVSLDSLETEVMPTVPEWKSEASVARPGVEQAGSGLSEPSCTDCGLQLAHTAGPGVGETGLVCQTPGCSLEGIDLIDVEGLDVGSGQECAARKALRKMIDDIRTEPIKGVVRYQVPLPSVMAAADEALSHPCRPALTREDAEKLADEFVVLWNETCWNIFAKPGYEQALETWKLVRRNMLADLLQRVAGERTHRVPCADPECRLCHFQLTDEDRAAIEGEKK